MWSSRVTAPFLVRLSPIVLVLKISTAARSPAGLVARRIGAVGTITAWMPRQTTKGRFVLPTILLFHVRLPAVMLGPLVLALLLQLGHDVRVGCVQKGAQPARQMPLS
ncbi:hypothetical protein XF30_20975 [Bradyrhizobium sp. SUTN9-2]|nr:hypothetical protein XF30_20975 [Bradyrhizobium sp. SUTN9-2]